MCVLHLATNSHALDRIPQGQLIDAKSVSSLPEASWGMRQRGTSALLLLRFVRARQTPKYSWANTSHRMWLAARFSLAPRQGQARIVTMEPFPDMESAYKSPRYRSLFCDALGRLTRKGLILQPADADDLIQSFFADAWQGLAANYDPTEGPPATYIYGAFVRFSFRFITRVHQWELRLQDMAALADLVADPATISPLDSLMQEEDIRRLREALTELPSSLRTVLLEFFTRGPRSKRQLARQYKISRYQLDELLINAFGHLIVRLGVRGAWPIADWEVALALWCEGLKPEEAAARLGLSLSRVRETRERLKKILVGILSNRLADDLARMPKSTE